MARVTVEDCIEKVENRFELIIAASQRAREISNGVQIEVDKDNDKNTVISLREIGDGAITYDDLKESDVLGWVYDSLIEGEETADEAKKRIEDDRTAKVQGQIDKAASQATGLPW